MNKEEKGVNRFSIVTAKALTGEEFEKLFTYETMKKNVALIFVLQWVSDKRAASQTS